MDETTVQYWPKSVPETLWNYGLLKTQQPPPFPFMGFRFETNFLIAFIFGFLFITFFGWRRFKDKTFDSKSFSYRVLTELDLTALRGRAAMQHAYLIYAGTLGVLYVILTFFGKLIFETVGQLPIVGAQVDVGGLEFSNPQWPLLLAFGFAGFAPLIPPLEAAETWLRRRAHEAVGIPTRIDQLARRIIDNFEREGGHHNFSNGPARLKTPAWVITHFGSQAVATRIGKIYDELRRFKEWSEEEDPDWPNRSVRSDLRRLERETTANARTILQEYDDILRQPYDRTVKANDTATKDSHARRRQLRHRLDAAVQRMTELRGDLAAIIAVYADGDRDFDKIVKPQHHELKDALIKTFAFMRIRTGPEVALIVALPAIFLIYAVACAAELHPLLKQVPVTLWTATATATVETLRFAAVFTLPSVAAFALRFYLLDRAAGARITQGQTPRLTTMERLLAATLGGVTSVILLCGVALLWAAALSPTSTHFQQLLFRTPGFLIYFVAQAITSTIVIYGALVACDVNGKWAVAKRRSLGIICATLVLAWLLRLILWNKLKLVCVGPDPSFPLGLLDKACFRDNSSIDFVIYPLFAYLACAVFGTLQRGGSDRTRDRSPSPRRGGAVAALAIGVILVTLALPARPAFSQNCSGASDTDCDDTNCPESCDVTIGFRADAEPFSFLVKTDDRKQYQGYLADLCYALFNGSAYQVTSVGVTVRDRFDRIRGAVNPAPGVPVDVLCDPLTLRFSEPTQELSGFYSPIIFASGVTYLLRKTNAPRSVAYLGYAEHSTARQVVKKACQVDLFRIRDPNETPSPEECELPDSRGPQSSPKECDNLGAVPKYDKSLIRQRGQPAYIFCPKGDHTELIRWFCRRPADGGLASIHIAYFGDREIIQGKLAAYVKQPKHQCPEAEIEIDGSNYTYEPYALVVSLRRPELAQFVQRRTYEFFSHPGNARGLFQKHFPKQQMSVALAYLYLLNGVMERDAFTVETIGDDAVRTQTPGKETAPPSVSGRSGKDADQQVTGDARLRSETERADTRNRQ